MTPELYHIFLKTVILFSRPFLTHLLGRPTTLALFDKFIASKDVSSKSFKIRALFFSNKINARCVLFLRFLRELFILFAMPHLLKVSVHPFCLPWPHLSIF